MGLPGRQREFPVVGDFVDVEMVACSSALKTHCLSFSVVMTFKILLFPGSATRVKFKASSEAHLIFQFCHWPLPILLSDFHHVTDPETIFLHCAC